MPKLSKYLPRLKFLQPALCSVKFDLNADTTDLLMESESEASGNDARKILIFIIISNQG